MTRPQAVSVVGLGKLGLCLAAVAASSGFKVVGVDTNKSLVELVNGGATSLVEPGLAELIRRSAPRLSATTDYRAAITSTEATFVVVPTPSTPTGEFSLDYVKAATKSIGRCLASKSGYHLVVITSTVMPGAMDGTVVPLLEGRSGKQLGKDFGLCYNPEFIALGEVIKGLFEPDFILVGESDKRAGDLLAEIHAKICKNSPMVERMSFVNAELAKIAVNSFVTMKLSFANTLAEVCERLPLGDVDAVTGALGRDHRIGAAYLKGALGYGGPCFPRDNVAFAKFAERIGVRADLATSTHTINKRQASRVVKIAESLIKPRSKIGLLGITYKPNTNVIEESQSLIIARELAARGYEVHAFDPSFAKVRELRGEPIKFHRTASECIAESEMCIIGTPWPQFSKLRKSSFEGKTVIDCWRILKFPPHDEAYRAIGKFMPGFGPS